MKIVIGGDLVASVNPAAVPTDNVELFAEENAAGVFGDVLDLFSSADYTVVNLECAITEHDVGIKKHGPCLRAPLATAKMLAKAGVTHCTLSNNHIFDFGKRGLYDTLAALDEAGLDYTGIGENYEDSRRDLILEKDGVRVAIVDVCEHEYSYALDDRVGARPFDEFDTMHDIREAKKTADYVIVIYHGGKEYCRYPSPRLYRACHEMAECGADVVICQHSHIIGCYETYEGSHILYGQGNFQFVREEYGPSWNEGFAAVIDIDGEGLHFDVVPVAGNGKGGIEIARGTRRDDIMTIYKKISEELVSGEWKRGWRTFCEEHYKQYKDYICGYKYEDDLDATQPFSHYLDCEAHRDVWMELFPTWNKSNEL